MKRTVRLALIGAMLQGGAHAAEQNADAKLSQEKGQDKIASVQQGGAKAKQKAVQGKKPSANAKSSNPAKEKLDGAMPTPADQVEQSVELKGVRG